MVWQRLSSTSGLWDRFGPTVGTEHGEAAVFGVCPITCDGKFTVGVAEEGKWQQEDEGGGGGGAEQS